MNNQSLWTSTVTAVGGLLSAIRTEKKVRQVVFAMTGCTVVCVLSDIGYFQIMFVVFSWVLALICEMFNTSIEKALDYASGKAYHPLIRQGKDYAAACTLVAVCFASTLTLVILGDRLFGSFFQNLF